MSGLRIGIDARIVPGAFGGVEQFTLGLVHSLSHLDDGDEEYVVLVNPGQGDWLAGHVGRRGRIVVAASGLGETLTPDAPLLRRLRRTASDRLPAVRDAWRVLRSLSKPRGGPVPVSDGVLESESVDVLHFPMQSGFLSTIPTIYQPWDVQHLHYPEFFGPAAVRDREARYRTLCNQASLIIVASNWTRDDIGARYSIPTAKFRVIPVPPIVEFYPTPSRADLDAVRARFDLPADFIYYPAQAWPHKNHERLLRALAAAGEAVGGPIPLVCSGGVGDHTRRVDAEARRLGLDRQYRQVGYVGELEVQCLYRLARGVVFPSLFEGWGMPILEAYHAGTPVASSNAPSVLEAAGDAALLFDPLDELSIQRAIEALWTDSATRETLVAAGARRIQALSWDRTAREYRQVYRELEKPSDA